MTNPSLRERVVRALETVSTAPSNSVMTRNVVVALIEQELKGLGSDIKAGIKNQLDSVKVVPHDPSKVHEAEIIHTILVRAHQEPVDQAVEKRIKGEG